MAARSERDGSARSAETSCQCPIAYLQGRHGTVSRTEPGGPSRWMPRPAPNSTSPPPSRPARPARAGCTSTPRWPSRSGRPPATWRSSSPPAASRWSTRPTAWRPPSPPGPGAAGPRWSSAPNWTPCPAVGHACGHNLISTAAIGAGLALAPLADELGFRVTVLGTPAEEKIGGKVDLIDAGAFSGAALAMMVHPDDRGHRRPAHPGGEPPGGRVPREDGARLRLALGGAQRPRRLRAGLRQRLGAAPARCTPPTRCTASSPTAATPPTSSPTTPGRSGTSGPGTKARLDEFYPGWWPASRPPPTPPGCTVEITPVGHEYQDLVSDPVLGVLCTTPTPGPSAGPWPAGPERDPATGGSTDMGNVSHVVPAIHPFLDLGCAPVTNHQPEFAAATLTPEGDRMLRDGALAMAWTVIDLAVGRPLGGVGNRPPLTAALSFPSGEGVARVLFLSLRERKRRVCSFPSGKGGGEASSRRIGSVTHPNASGLPAQTHSVPALQAGPPRPEGEEQPTSSGPPGRSTSP